MKTLGCAAQNHYLRPISQQIHSTLQAREAKYELLPTAQDQNVGVLVWSPLAGGLLSGKYQRNKQDPEGARHLLGWTEPPVYDTEKLYVIIGARTTQQLTDNLQAVNLKLSTEDLSRRDKVSRPPFLYPYWHQATTAADRLSTIDHQLLQPYIDDVDEQ